MHKFLYLFILPVIAFSFDISNFYDFQSGTRWGYEFELTDSIIKNGFPTQDYYQKSKIEYLLDAVLKTDSGKVFFFSGKDTVYSKKINVFGDGKVTDTTYISLHKDTIAVAIKATFSYCLGKNHPTPYFCPYVPLCTNISDSTGEFFTKNDTLFYSRKNDNSLQMFYTNYRVWCVFVGCTYSYTKNCYTDNFTITTTKLVSFKEPISNINATHWRNSSATFTITKLFVNFLSIPKVSSAYFIYHNGQMYSLNGQRICINPTVIHKRPKK